MQVTVSDSGTLRKTLTIAYPKDEVAARRSQILKQLGAQVRLPGFRPGKVSTSVIESRYGSAADEETVQKLADEALSGALKSHGLRPLGPMTTDKVERENGLTLTLSFEVRPTVTLPEFTQLTVEQGSVAVDDAAVDEHLGMLCRRAGTMGALSETDTVIEDDSITVSGTISVDGVEVRQLHGFNHLVGGYPFFGKQPADVIEALKDKKAGDTVTFTTTLPASFTPAEHKGKEATVSLTIQAANRLRAATADDEFAKRMGTSSLDELKGNIRTMLTQQRTAEQRGKQANALIESLITQVQIELPPLLLADATAQALKDTETRLAGKAAEEIATAKEESTANIAKSMRRSIILDALADHLQVDVTQDDISDQIRMAAQQTGRRPEDIAKQLRDSGRATQVLQEIREAKAIESLLDRVLAAHQPSAAQA